MAPVEFTVTGGEGSPLDFVAALTPASSFVVITDPGGWAQVSRGLAVGCAATTAVATRVRPLRFAVVDLRHFSSAAELPSIPGVPGDLVALHDTRSWDSAPLVTALRALGRPVVLFTAVHTWVPGVDPATVLVGWSAPHVVVAVPRGAGEGRVEDVLWQFRELERRRMMTYTALPAPPPPPDREVAVVVALPGATEGIAGALRPGADYEVWVRVGAGAAPLPADLELKAVLCMNGRAVQSESFVLPADGAGPWVSFPVTTPYASVPWGGELVVYRGVVPVHVQQVVLPVGSGESRARLRFRLSRTFADLAPLSSRTASVLVLGERALVMAGHEPHRVSLGPTGELPPVTGLDPWYGKGFPEFCEDLAAFAVRGAALHRQLSGDGAVVRRGGVITVAGSTRVPWAHVYDLPFAEGPYRLCASVSQFGPFGAGGEVPPHCPVPDHSGNVLCPFGFWGLSSVLEQPPGPLAWQVAPAQRQVQVVLAVDPALDRTLTQRHVAELMSFLPPDSISSAYVSPPDLSRALSDERADVMHLVYDEGALEAVEVDGWPHRPLVVTTSPAAHLVDAFVNRAGAAGVVCPEVAVDQGMAGWVSGMLLARLAGGMPAGEALRRTRWEMLGRGNVLGLAYALHAGADLRLR
ncbi:hypothetical protein SAMN05216188_120112 [Lentzea xinjiangensis]|uniref:Uncharacterized protein n=1 Tax=Lentzea xinjiangensis TaxID=402600 RepID=A0A1H9U6L2_9PSEU|nr:hypothetical protein [Lentzea xinjiangensis]SES04989.1 hypothetical protein SAMN05216188_120112 [Lentzea xinjiangensis]